MTLMPVSSSSTEGDSSRKAGAFWWMARRASVPIGPASSIGRPSTSMMRPRVAWPTGTEIGAPVPLTFMPRRSPSDEPMAMVRTTPSPSCCCTSNVRPSSAPFSLGSIIRASKTLGISPRGNLMSTTAPMHCTICPLLMICPQLLNR